MNARLYENVRQTFNFGHIFRGINSVVMIVLLQLCSTFPKFWHLGFHVPVELDCYMFIACYTEHPLEHSFWFYLYLVLYPMKFTSSNCSLYKDVMDLCGGFQRAFRQFESKFTADEPFWTDNFSTRIGTGTCEYRFYTST